ncbi:hypothetical protein Vau01_016780 [Virgisporangium aurantiacum]|uniref:Uncharacterized protein n=1 Tax=Virgisporangium aurantiacum TaxID=175570 RepID=A0A8J4DZL7_9ACTN|nr:hypothetical protein Vau01_016780 [Virgisporangium aurantiacum]
MVQPARRGRRVTVQARSVHPTTRNSGRAQPTSPATTIPPTAADNAADNAAAENHAAEAPGAEASLTSRPATTIIGRASFVTRSQAFDTTTNRTNSGVWWPQARAIARFTAVLATAPNGSSFVTALPDRLSVRARRRVSPGIDAASATVCTAWPSSHTTASTTGQVQDRPRIVCHAADHDTPAADRRRPAQTATTPVASSRPARSSQEGQRRVTVEQRFGRARSDLRRPSPRPPATSRR